MFSDILPQNSYQCCQLGQNPVRKVSRVPSGFYIAKGVISLFLANYYYEKVGFFDQEMRPIEIINNERDHINLTAELFFFAKKIKGMTQFYLQLETSVQPKVWINGKSMNIQRLSTPTAARPFYFYKIFI